MQEGAGRQTEETCTTYNMLKIARYLFAWTGDAKYADYYEKALLNGMIGTQRMPSDYSPHLADRHPLPPLVITDSDWSTLHLQNSPLLQLLSSLAAGD